MLATRLRTKRRNCSRHFPGISPKQRAAIVLHHHAGYSLKEV